MKGEILHEGVAYERMNSPHFCIMPEATLEITSPHLCIMATEGLETYREPIINIRNTPKEFIISVEMPGVPKNQIEIALTGKLLEIEGKCKGGKRKPDSTYVESASQLFYKWLELPEEVEQKDIRTTQTNGILEITLPKQAPSKTRKITV